MLFDHYQLLDNTKCKPTNQHTHHHSKCLLVWIFCIFAIYSCWTDRRALFYSLLLVIVIIIITFRTAAAAAAVVATVADFVESLLHILWLFCFVLFNFLFICCRLSVFYLVFFSMPHALLTGISCPARCSYVVCCCVVFCIDAEKMHTHTVYLYIYPPHYYLLPYRHLIRTSLRCTHSVRSGGPCHKDLCFFMHVCVLFALHMK